MLSDPKPCTYTQSDEEEASARSDRRGGEGVHAARHSTVVSSDHPDLRRRLRADRIEWKPVHH
jgi:hypothetical protein